MLMIFCELIWAHGPFRNAPFPLDFHFRTMKTLGSNAWGTAYDNEANMKEHPSVYCHMTILHHHHW
jgi:hypothetical protein